MTSDYFVKLRTLSERFAQSFKSFLSFKPVRHPVEIMLIWLIWISDNPFRNHGIALQIKILRYKVQ